MNTVFESSRFISYGKREFNPFIKQIALILIAIGSLYSISLILGIAKNLMLAQLFIIITKITALFSICISPAILEPSLLKNKSVFNFILPVSNFERFLGIWIKHIVAIPVVIFLFFLLLNQVSGFVGLLDNDFLFSDSFEKGISLEWSEFMEALAVQSIFMLTYLYFRQYAVFKTFLVMIVGMLVIIFISLISMKIWLGGEFFIIGINDLFTPASFLYQWTSKSNCIINVIDTIFKIIFPFGLWLVSYFKLKEIEI